MHRYMTPVVTAMSAAVAALAPLGPGALAAPASFGVCAACHTVAAGAPSTFGPNLRGVVGRKAGTLPGYSYSPAMKGSGLIWTKVNLAAFITSPQGKVPGSKMPYMGQKDPAKVAEIIAYLATLK